MYFTNDNHRETYLIWSLEFLKRGLVVDGGITVHGPHDASGAVWGSAEIGWVDPVVRSSFDSLEDNIVHFSAGPSRHKYDVRGMRIFGPDRFVGDGQVLFPKRRVPNLSLRVQKLMTSHQRHIRILKKNR